jgi:hypothetical protein
MTFTHCCGRRCGRFRTQGRNVRFQFSVAYTYNACSSFYIGNETGGSEWSRVRDGLTLSGETCPVWLGGIYAFRGIRGMGGESLKLPFNHLQLIIPSAMVNQFSGIFHGANLLALPGIFAVGIESMGRQGWMATPYMPIWDKRSAGGQRYKSQFELIISIGPTLLQKHLAKTKGGISGHADGPALTIDRTCPIQGCCDRIIH